MPATRSVFIPSEIAWFLMTLALARLMISRRIVSETGKTSMTAARPW
jgi:hypothetical protein